MGMLEGGPGASPIPGPLGPGPRDAKSLAESQLPSSFRSSSLKSSKGSASSFTPSFESAKVSRNESASDLMLAPLLQLLGGPWVGGPSGSDLMGGGEGRSASASSLVRPGPSEASVALASTATALFSFFMVVARPHSPAILGAGSPIKKG